MLDIAQEIINRMSGHFEPDTFTDRYEEAVVGMLRAKQAGRDLHGRRAVAPANVVNIMDALKKSLEAAGGDRRRAPAARAQQDRPRSAGRQGGGAQAGAKKPAARKAARG